jgi:hypothetical protein
MKDFFDNFYGVLFNPSETFDKLKESPALIQGFMIVVIISILSPVLKFSINSAQNPFFQGFELINASFWGLLSWLFFASFLEVVAGIFKKGGKIKIFLCLSAFALIPWIFIGPASLFKTGGLLFKALGIIIGLASWLWSTILTAFAIMKTYEISAHRVITFVLIPFLGGILSFYWFFGFFTTLIQIIQ